MNQIPFINSQFTGPSPNFQIPVVNAAPSPVYYQRNNFNPLVPNNLLQNQIPVGFENASSNMNPLVMANLHNMYPKNLSQSPLPIGIQNCISSQNPSFAANLNNMYPTNQPQHQATVAAQNSSAPGAKFKPKITILKF